MSTITVTCHSFHQVIILSDIVVLQILTWANDCCGSTLFFFSNNLFIIFKKLTCLFFLGASYCWTIWLIVLSRLLTWLNPWIFSHRCHHSLREILTLADVILVIRIRINCTISLPCSSSWLGLSSLIWKNIATLWSWRI